MDSINRNQPEHNREDLTGTDAVKRIREVVDKAKTCFFCTHGPDGESRGARPMAVQEVDDAGNLWFLSAVDSHKNEELAHDDAVRLYFQGTPHSDFLYLSGRGTVSQDKKRIRELWTPVAKVWFTEGVDDPRITVIKVTPSSGHYWDTKHGILVAGVKMLFGAMIGKTLDDSVEGTVRVGGRK